MLDTAKKCTNNVANSSNQGELSVSQVLLEGEGLRVKGGLWQAPMYGLPE